MKGMGRGGFPGLGGLGDMAGLMKKAQKMQEDMLALQEELANARFEASSGGGVVKATVDGKGALVALEIKPEAVDPEDVEMLQDLIVAAVQEAGETARAEQEEKMQALAGGLGMPGLNLPGM